MTETLKIPISDMDRYTGPKNALVTILEYGDYECPYSRAVAPALEELLDEYEKEVAFVFRHFPMRNIHPHAELAAQAAEAAAEQDYFWEMHHLLFKSDEVLNIENIFLLAQSTGLNMNQFSEDFEGRKVIERIELQFKGAQKSGISSTPTFFLNDVRFDESSSYHPLKNAINQILGQEQRTTYY